MSSFLDPDTYSQPGDWLFGTLRRNPEALLLMGPKLPFGRVD